MFGTWGLQGHLGRVFSLMVSPTICFVLVTVERPSGWEIEVLAADAVEISVVFELNITTEIQG